MSTSNLLKFTEIVAKDPALLARIGVGQASDEVLIANAMQEGKALGLEFTHEQAAAWLKEETEKQAEGELSDLQLEAVAGGKADVDIQTIECIIGGGGVTHHG